MLQRRAIFMGIAFAMCCFSSMASDLKGSEPVLVSPFENISLDQVLPSASSEPNREHALNAMTPELLKELNVELNHLGYVQENMEFEANAIDKIESTEVRDKEAFVFLSKYQTLALAALKNLAKRASSVEAMDLVLDAEKLLQFRQPKTVGPLPQDIFLIYQQLGDQVMLLDQTPCLDWTTQVACSLASLVNQECSYFSSNWQDLPRNRIRTFASPETTCSSIAECTIPGGVNVINQWAHPGRGHQAVALDPRSVGYSNDSSITNSMGLVLPLQRRQNNMCVSFMQPENTRVIWGLEASYGPGRSILASAGYNQTAYVASSDPYAGGISVNHDNTGLGCADSIQLPARSASGREQNYKLIEQRPCWYKNLKRAYDLVDVQSERDLFRYQTPNVTDLDTLGAYEFRIGYGFSLDVDVHGLRTGGPYSEADRNNDVSGGIMMMHGGVEVLTVRDR
jgi:hypothetical protein